MEEDDWCDWLLEGESNIFGKHITFWSTQCGSVYNVVDEKLLFCPVCEKKIVYYKQMEIERKGE